MKKIVKDMRSFAEAYPDQQMVKQLVSQLPSGWETRLVESLPSELKGSLPTVEEIEAKLLRKGDKS